jgi:hypothetical protein
MKKGDKVEVLVGSGPYYKRRDIAVLVRIDSDGDWWADFTGNKVFRGEGGWCIGKPFVEFRLLGR